MSRDFWTVFRYELRRNLRRPGYLFTSFALPILLVVALFAYQTLVARDIASQDPQELAETLSETMGANNTQKSGYVDLSGLITTIPDDLGATFAAYDTVAAGEAALNSDEIQVLYVVQEDYLETGHIEIVQPSFSMGPLGTMPVVRALTESLTANVDEEARRFRLLDPSNLVITNQQLTTVGAGSSEALEGGTFLMVYVFAITLIMSLFMTNGYMMQTVIEEKETRLVEILISSIKARRSAGREDSGDGPAGALSGCGLDRAAVRGSVSGRRLRPGRYYRADRHAGQHPDPGRHAADPAGVFRSGRSAVRRLLRHHQCHFQLDARGAAVRGAVHAAVAAADVLHPVLHLRPERHAADNHEHRADHRAHGHDPASCHH
ncbi:MAG: ABC transporter permease [Chloroflexi bacterium]|nr:ABC transporter permease [Chloroflexota bacterium]